MKNEIKFEDITAADCAQPTSRLLSGTADFWAKEEWAEPVIIPDARRQDIFCLPLKILPATTAINLTLTATRGTLNT